MGLPRDDVRRETAQPFGQSDVGPSALYCSGVIGGMLTALIATPFFRYSTICSTMRTPTISCASSVEPAMCGVASTVSSAKQRQLGGRRLRLEHVQRGAGHFAGFESPPRALAASTISPRAQLMIRTPGFICAMASREIMLRVSGVSGHVQGDVIALGVQPVELHELDAQVAGDLRVT